MLSVVKGLKIVNFIYFYNIQVQKSTFKMHKNIMLYHHISLYVVTSKRIKTFTF